MSDRHARLLRSLAITTLILSLAAGAHVSAGGILPPPALLAALGVLILVPVTLAAGRPLSFRAVTTLIGLGQVSLHNAFAALSVPGHCLPSDQTGHLHHDMVSCTLAAVPTISAVDPLPMLGMHALAVLVTSAALARADAALATLRSWLAPLLGLVRVTALPVAALHLPSWPPLTICWATRHITHHGVRGPPRFLPAAFVS